MLGGARQPRVPEAGTCALERLLEAVEGFGEGRAPWLVAVARDSHERLEQRLGVAQEGLELLHCPHLNLLERTAQLLPSHPVEPKLPAGLNELWMNTRGMRDSRGGREGRAWQGKILQGEHGEGRRGKGREGKA